ncbi:hypothetical protein FKM82_019092 [Ascaphus truei]
MTALAVCFIPRTDLCTLCTDAQAQQKMAGRGRGGGGGRGQMTFNMEAVGIGRGEALPPPTLQPPPLFPALDFKPVPLQTGEELEYMLALKQELRGAMKGLPYYIKPAAPKKDVERYSDKYQTSGPVDNAIDWHPDWKLLPRELKIKVRKLPKESRYPASCIVTACVRNEGAYTIPPCTATAMFHFACMMVRTVTNRAL